ncbi:hypothetical protein DY000_02020354 [Brassica cretica]|uniref:At2g35280-like TPR domain-containing protein n=1 Tax=Brassica cretica TaxID=69181 RepID=A0ABQ7EG82_BRACR|nr:hypothetical protein DY000_02020354 [Brassica cretica]
MANFNLASLPPSTLHKILSKVATTSIRDFGSARVAFSGSNAVGKEDHFYKSVVFIFLNDWIYEVNVVRTFKLKCYQLGNPEANYLRGMYEYFILHLLDEGREKIHLAGDRGCMLAKYVDGMMNLPFSVDHRGLVHNYHAFTREYVDQMYHMITSWALSGHWGYNKPDVYVSIGKNISQRLI